jgi:hypothetical protein
MIHGGNLKNKQTNKQKKKQKKTKHYFVKRNCIVKLRVLARRRCDIFTQDYGRIVGSLANPLQQNSFLK